MLTGMEMNGIAHIQLTVNDYAACRQFYRKLFGWLGMRVIFDSPQVFYGVGSRTGIAICPSDPVFRGEPFQQRRIGLHHFCPRACTEARVGSASFPVAPARRAPSARRAGVLTGGSICAMVS